MSNSNKIKLTRDVIKNYGSGSAYIVRTQHEMTYVTNGEFMLDIALIDSKQRARFDDVRELKKWIDTSRAAEYSDPRWAEDVYRFKGVADDAYDKFNCTRITLGFGRYALRAYYCWTTQQTVWIYDPVRAVLRLGAGPLFRAKADGDGGHLYDSTNIYANIVVCSRAPNRTAHGWNEDLEKRLQPVLGLSLAGSIDLTELNEGK